MNAARIAPAVLVALVGLVPPADAAKPTKGAVVPSTTVKVPSKLEPQELVAMTAKLTTAPLLTKANVAKRGSVPIEALRAATTVSPAQPNAGGANFSATCPLTYETGEFPHVSFYNWSRNDRSPACETDWVSVRFNASRSLRYIVECSTSDADWKITATGSNGQKVVGTSLDSENPSLVIDPTADGRFEVQFSATGAASGVPVISLDLCRITPADRP